MIVTLAEVAERCPAVRKYREQGFELVRPILSLELEYGFEVETVNQRLRLSDFGREMQSVVVNPA